MKYHPDIELLLKYSSGQLAPPLAVAVGLHQYECKICQKKIKELEAIGGSTLESIDAQANVKQAAVSSIAADMSLFDQLLSDIDELPDTVDEEYDDIAIARSDVALFEQLNKRQLNDLPWKNVTRNISRAKILMDFPGYDVELFKFSPHAKIPKHTHCGREFTFVLEGDFSDNQGQYQRGAFIEQNQAHEHQPVAGSNGCICLAVTDAPLKFTGALGPFINWFNR